MFRRLVDPRADVSRRVIADLPTVIDRITASALHCDRIGLPQNWLQVLHEASELGGYALTHASLASEWTVENECRLATEVALLQHRQVELLKKMVDERELLAETSATSTDLWIEALAMLYYLRAGGEVESSWVAALVDAQHADGGWPNQKSEARSDPHPSALALWVLLENLEPEAPRIRWIP